MDVVFVALVVVVEIFELVAGALVVETILVQFVQLPYLLVDVVVVAVVEIVEVLAVVLAYLLAIFEEMVE